MRQSNTDWLIVRAFLLDASGDKVTTGSALLYLYELQSDGSLKTYDFYDKAFKTTVVNEEWLALTHRKGNGGTRDTGLWTAGFQVRREEESSSLSTSSQSTSTSTSLSTSSSTSTSTSLSSSSLSTLSSSSTSTSMSSSSSTSTSLSSSSSSSTSSSSGSSSSQSMSESSPADETEFTVGNIYIAVINHSSASPPWQAREFQWGEQQGDGLDAIADRVLNRDWTQLAEEVKSRTLLQAARFLRNKFSTTANPGNVTVYEEDDATEAYRKTVVTDAAAVPIVQG